MLASASTARPRTLQDLLSPALMHKLDRLDVLSRKVFGGKLPGERRSKRRGQSVEFDDYRQYVAGDDLRHIDWNVFARMDRFFLKLFREDEDLALYVVLDASASMDAGTPNKLLFAQRLAMALGYIGLVNQNRVVPAIVGAPGRPNVQMLSPIRGRTNVQRLAQFVLTGVWPAAGDRAAAGGGSLNDALRTVAMSRSGRGVMILISDFLVREDLRTGFNYLAGGGVGGEGTGFDTTCIQVLSPGELDPASEAREGGAGLIGDLRLTDAETGLAAEVTVSAALLKRYHERLEAHLEGVRTACVSRGMAHMLVRSDAEVDKLLLETLRKRGLLR